MSRKRIKILMMGRRTTTDNNGRRNCHGRSASWWHLNFRAICHLVKTILRARIEINNSWITCSWGGLLWITTASRRVRKRSQFHIHASSIGILVIRILGSVSGLNSISDDNCARNIWSAFIGSSRSSRGINCIIRRRIRIWCIFWSRSCTSSLQRISFPSICSTVNGSVGSRCSSNNSNSWEKSTF